MSRSPWRWNSMYGLVPREPTDGQQRGLGQRTGLETQSVEEERTVVWTWLPVWRYKDPKCHTVGYSPQGWVSKQQLERSEKALEDGTEDVTEAGRGAAWRSWRDRREGERQRVDQTPGVPDPRIGSSGPCCGLSPHFLMLRPQNTLFLASAEGGTGQPRGRQPAPRLPRRPPSLRRG